MCQQELLGAPDSMSCPEEENVEGVCQFFNTIGKDLDESPKSRRINDIYFNRLKDLSTDPQLAPHVRFMLHNVLDLRSNNWVSRREEVDILISSRAKVDIDANNELLFHCSQPYFIFSIQRNAVF
jgi:hypothetical protein